jgi:hypothetical protein
LMLALTTASELQAYAQDNTSYEPLLKPQFCFCAFFENAHPLHRLLALHNIV